MSSSTSRGNLFFESSTQQSSNRAASSSSTHLIDLTVPAPPRIIHPSTLPSQSVEIIEIDSEDEESSHIFDNQDEDGDEEVQFISETPAAPGGSSSSSSWDSRGSLQPSLDNLLLRYFSEQEETEFWGSGREEEHRWQSLSRTPRPRENRQIPTDGVRATAGRDARRPLRERIQSSGIWGAHGPAAGSPGASAAARRLSNQLEEAAGTASYLREYLNLFHPRDHEMYHPYRTQHQRHRRPLTGWLFGSEDPIDFYPGYFTRVQSPEEQAQAPTMDTEQGESERKPQIPARLGYTKSLDQDVIIACPVCKNELGHRKEDTKLWVVVGCGHVICDDCIESIFLFKVMLKRKPAAAKKSKSKGKAKWMAPGDADEDSVNHGGGEADEASLLGMKATNTEEAFKMVKKQSGNCPSCNRKIKKASIQQLFL
ncbi:hypothetical protein BGX27_007614 [Mortierella sp. AM989]|nr:hypothetical protein BGX27_007614 [Mortierella sp. AM989]